MKRKSGVNFNLKITMLAVSFLFVIIAAKLIFVSMSDDVDGIDLKAFAESRNTEEKTLYASRGAIYDRNGEVLAINANSYTVIAYLSESRTTDENNPQHVVDKETTAKALAPILGKSEEKILDLLNRENLYQIELQRGVSEVEKNQIVALDLAGIDFISGYKRSYPLGDYASYIIGYARKDDSGEISGEMGLEAYFDDTLKGKNGWIKYQKDAYGYQMPNTPVYQEEAESGADIYLTLDQNIQLIVENAINTLETNYKMSWATISVMDAKTGAILGSASSPSFNLNTLDGLESYLNPLTSYQYEPGSTMKIFSFMNAIEEGIYDGSATFMSGSITLKDGTRIKDFNNTGWGEIDYDTGFAYSSNVAATNLALQLGTKKLRSFYETLGFGKTTGIELPGELSGTVNFNYESELANASFGQGVTTTPVQMLQALSTIANEGTMIKPYIVEKIVDDEGNVIKQNGRTEVTKVASKETIDKIKDLMYKMVYGGFESSKKFATDNVSLIGKTGTAQIASPSGGYLGGEYDYVKSFAGLFPYEDPQYIIYFSVKQLVGGTNDMAEIVSNVVEEVAKTMNLTDAINDVDETKIIELSSYISNQIETTAEELKNKGLTPIVIGKGKYVVNQYPLHSANALIGSKVFLLSNDTSYEMPNVIGWSTNEIVSFCNLIGLKYNLNGYGNVVSINMEVGKTIDLNSILEINLAT